jgi:glycerol uptake facilitator protein
MTTAPENSADSNRADQHAFNTTAGRLAGELVGTFLLVFFGCGVVHSAVLFSATSGVWQIAVVWALAIAIAIYSCSRFSDAHFNPAVSLAFAIWGDLPWYRVPLYWLMQFSGAFLAAALLYGIYAGQIQQYEAELSIERGSPASKLSAMCYGEFTPNPDTLKPLVMGGTISEAAHTEWMASTPLWRAMLVEAVGTAILVFAIFSFSDSRGMLGSRAEVAAAMIGLTVAALICLLAPITQAGFNPARDFGPRVFTYFAGWGRVAFWVDGGLGWFWIYIIGPFLGGIVGGGVHTLIARYPSLNEFEIDRSASA